MKRIICIIVIGLCTLDGLCFADSLQWNLPWGIGTVQLPWQSTEILAGGSFRYKRPVTGASLPVLTIGKLANGYRILDGELGATSTFGTQGDNIQPYTALGHDIIQDISGLSQFKSVHLNLWGGMAFDKGPSLNDQLDYGGSLSWSFN